MKGPSGSELAWNTPSSSLWVAKAGWALRANSALNFSVPRGPFTLHHQSPHCPPPHPKGLLWSCGSRVEERPFSRHSWDILCLLKYFMGYRREQHDNKIQALKPPSLKGTRGSDYWKGTVTVSQDERTYGDRRLHSNVNARSTPQH